MTTILDTAKAVKCGSCKSLISPNEPKLVLGYGPLLIILHPECLEIEKIARKL
jgi:hypothetical protein